MCNICNGTHRDNRQEGSLVFVGPCPECGPMTPEELAIKRAPFRKRLKEALARAERVVS